MHFCKWCSKYISLQRLARSSDILKCPSLSLPILFFFSLQLITIPWPKDDKPHAYCQGVFSSVWNQRLKLPTALITWFPAPHFYHAPDSSDHHFILLLSLTELPPKYLEKDSIPAVSMVSFPPWSIRTLRHAYQDYRIHLLKSITNFIYSEISRRPRRHNLFLYFDASLLKDCLCRIGQPYFFCLRLLGAEIMGVFYKMCLFFFF